MPLIPIGSKAGAMAQDLHVIGPGGAGKSTIGVLLAKRLQVPFLDLDRQFVTDFGDISEYIDRHGCFGEMELIAG
jgi:shikimate kinase